MRDYVIVADSACDLTKEQRKEYGIDYVKMHLVVDGKEMPADLDWEVYSAKEFYDWIRAGKRISTTQVPVSEYEETFTKHLKQGKDILYIACSSGLSGSINIAKNVIEELSHTYPDSKIICVDALRASFAQGILCMKAVELKNKGQSIEEVAKFVTEFRDYTHQCGTLETLTYLKNAGRIKASKAFFGNLFGVKPIIIADAKGQNYAIRKSKGRKASLQEIVNTLKNEGEDLENQIIYMVHGDCMDDAMNLKQMIENECHPKGVSINMLGPIVGGSTGPGMIGIYFCGKKVEVIGD